ncbi:elongation factor-1 alpha [Methylomonas sp. MED-D]|uniref:elongation factor-1 alpha n=1 Tax=unclassified Methylomonas TaxID=2608980 RepID=UPI0008DA8980|nr:MULTISPECIES: elongation factor-1 alpha [unclassified Methylomonas]MDT4329643.1 elongation factor-1 alpha [Methylomonas sp. MV1]NJA07030.1 elongation factor-1 alpha [Methylococcaceae bacterium WWC4]OHX38424.1 elongation factor-1 alpha [Methylomonas sp. LWB]WGS87183.1 elongation factor-1 alpha [Methylomonas sp. UP202]
MNCDPPTLDRAGKGINLISFGTSIKLLFSGYLTTVGAGYLMALIQILFTHGMADGKFGLSLDDIVYSYYGDRSGSVLESKLNGSMKYNAPDQERFKIIQWVRDGAEEATYDRDIKPIVETRCLMCHNASAGSLPDFGRFDNLKKLAASNEGATFQSLIRISHIHLFGISFIFMFVGIIFSFSTGVPCKYKYPAVVMPYLFLLIDIASWWLTKLNPHFALLVILAGAGLGVAFAFMWTVSMYQMWILGGVLKRKDRRNAVMRD